ncbi:MAG TPA: APC family permease [Candidatus Acidoferrum sp.]|nr:APC family permease [Candidatus Acidoferrum sp.]
MAAQSVFGAGLALGLWLYSGYEQLSSVAEEVENPQRTYPRALVTVVPLSVATYFLPTLFSLAALGNWEKWHTGYFSTAAQLIGGPWLGIPITIGAMIGNVALLNATVLTSTRMPSTMAEDGYLPAAFSARHPR